MSSPSSTSSGKRKRTMPSERVRSTNDLLQPSSRDASGEELADEAPTHNLRQRKHNASNSIDSSVPPNKRARTRSNATETMKANGSLAANGADEDGDMQLSMQDPGEPSSATEDSQDIEEREKRKVRRATGNGKNGSSGQKSQDIEAPPKAGLTDPVGYKTNLPPVDRPVRVYADGVFDLFHLGYVHLLPSSQPASH